MIRRADFIGFTVLGPGRRAQMTYRADGNDAWAKGWTATLEGPHLILEGEGQRIEVPRARCVVYLDPGQPVAKEPAVKAPPPAKKVAP